MIASPGVGQYLEYTKGTVRGISPHLHQPLVCQPSVARRSMFLKRLGCIRHRDGTVKKASAVVPDCCK